NHWSLAGRTLMTFFKFFDKTSLSSVRRGMLSTLELPESELAITWVIHTLIRGSLAPTWFS
ncbi:hypothetical protein, partial [Vibrio sp. 10N.261.51.E5]